MDAAKDLPVDRHGLEVLPPDQCWELLARTPVGRVAFVDAGEPVVFPVTHGVHDRQIVFRTGTGTKLGAAEMNQSLAFEVDEWDAAEHTGWSVLVRGIGETVYDEADIAAFEALGTPPWLDSATQGTWVRIRVEEITGRRLPG